MQTRVAPHAEVIVKVPKVIDFQFDRLRAGWQFDVDGDDARLRVFVDAFRVGPDFVLHMMAANIVANRSEAAHALWNLIGHY